MLYGLQAAGNGFVNRDFGRDVRADGSGFLCRDIFEIGDQLVDVK